MTAGQRDYWLAELAWLRDVLADGHPLSLEVRLVLLPVLEMCERMLRETPTEGAEVTPPASSP